MRTPTANMRRLRAMVNRHEGRQRVPPPETWTRTVVARVNREVPNPSGLTYKSDGLVPLAARIPMPVYHARGLPVGEWRDFECEGSEWCARGVMLPEGCDRLADEMWEWMESGRPMNVSMATVNAMTSRAAPGLVLGAAVEEISLIGTERPGIEGARVIKVYLAPPPPSPEVARLLAEGQARADDEMAKRWNAALGAHGWRRG